MTRDCDLQAADLRYQLWLRRINEAAAYASGVVDRIVDRPADVSHRARLTQRVRSGVEAIIAREGVFRDSKPTGCFVAEVPTR